jgi:hypothetical protein
MMKMVQFAYGRTMSLEKSVLIMLILFLQLSFIPITKADTSSTGLRPNSVSQEIVIDPWGNVFYYDSYSISNIGEVWITYFRLQLPKEAEDISVYDMVGDLNFESEDVEDANNITIALRYPLKGGDDGYSCSFTVKYRVNAEKRLTQMKLWSRYKFETEVSTDLNWTIKNYMVKVTLPEGARILQSMPSKGNVSKNLLTYSITYVFQNVTHATKFNLEVEYDYLIFWPAFRPTLWAVLIAAIIGAITVLRRRGRPSPAFSGGDLDLIRSFVETCDRRLILWSEVESLEESLDDRGIGKNTYKRRKRVLEKRIRASNKALTNLINRMRRAGERYKSLAERVEKSEEEIKVLKAEVNRRRAQLRSGRLSKNVYKRQKRSYDQAIKKAKAIIEGVIIELKGEAG